MNYNFLMVKIYHCFPCFVTLFPKILVGCVSPPANRNHQLKMCRDSEIAPTGEWNSSKRELRFPTISSSGRPNLQKVQEQKTIA